MCDLIDLVETMTKAIEPEIVEDDGDVHHAVCAFFDEEAYIRYWATSEGEIVIQSMHSSPSIRGRDMLKWLDTKYDMPIAVVEATYEADGFWSQMQKDGLVYSIDGADGEPSYKEKISVPLPG